MERALHDERELFCLIASGDEEAFRLFFERYKGQLVTFLTRITKSPEDAKELAQEIFLSLWINRAKLSSLESPRKYLFVVARHKAIDFLRKAAADEKMRTALWHGILQHASANEHHAAADGKTTRIHEAMGQLSRQRQLVFQLSRMEGLTHDQIATRLSISKNTVKNHIVASLKFIRKYVSVDD